MDRKIFDQILKEDLKVMKGVSNNWIVPFNCGGYMRTKLGLTLATEFNKMINGFYDNKSDDILEALERLKKITVEIYGKNQ